MSTAESGGVAAIRGRHGILFGVRASRKGSEAESENQACALGCFYCSGSIRYCFVPDDRIDPRWRGLSLARSMLMPVADASVLLTITRLCVSKVGAGQSFGLVPARGFLDAEIRAAGAGNLRALYDE